MQEAVDGLGGTISVTAGKDSATVGASALTENFTRLTEIMADVLLHPAFPTGRIGDLQAVDPQSLVLQRQQPGFLAAQEFNKVVYGQHPYGVSSTTPAAVQALTPEKLRAFYQAHYTPRGAVLVVVGDIKPAAAFAQLTKSAGRLDRTDRRERRSDLSRSSRRRRRRISIWSIVRDPCSPISSSAIWRSSAAIPTSIR